MAYQFFHIETYSAQARPVNGSTDHYNSVAQVFGEAARDPQYSKHVESPLPPKQLFGTLTLSGLMAKHAALLATLRQIVTRKNGTTYTRALRKDAATLYTEIHSHPLTTAAFLADSETHYEAIGEWIKRVRADFQKRMPKGIDYTAVLHLDETYVHIHILAINTLDPKLDANKLHVGKVAGALFRSAHVSDAVTSLPKPDLAPRPKMPRKPKLSKNPVTGARNDLSYATALTEWRVHCNRINAENADLTTDWKRRNALHLKQGRRTRGKPQVHQVYTAAMKTLQDDYYEAVGKPSGLMRDGPRQARKSTKTYAADKRQAKRLAQNINLLKQEGAALAQIATELVARAAEVAQAVAAMAQILDAVEAGESAVVDGKLYLPQMPAILARLAPGEAPPSSVTALVRRFVGLVVKHHDRLGGGGAAFEPMEGRPQR